MFQAMQNATSAVRALTRGMVVSAHNIANSATEGFHPLEAVLEERPGGGVGVRIETRNDVEGVDLTEETVKMIARETAIKANLAVIRASDKTLGVLLDTVG